MAESSKDHDTMVIHTSKLEFYQDEKKKVNEKLAFYMNEKKAIEEKINKELPTPSDKAKEKRKAEERDKADLKSLRKSIDSMNPDSKQDEETKKGQKIKVQIKKNKTTKEEKKESEVPSTSSTEPKKEESIKATRKVYSKEIKDEALRLCKIFGKSKVSEDSGIHMDNLTRWEKMGTENNRKKKSGRRIKNPEFETKLRNYIINTRSQHKPLSKDSSHRQKSSEMK